MSSHGPRKLVQSKTKGASTAAPVEEPQPFLIFLKSEPQPFLDWSQPREPDYQNRSMGCERPEKKKWYSYKSTVPAPNIGCYVLHSNQEIQRLSAIWKKRVNFHIYTVSATSTATIFVGRSLPGPKRIQISSPKETKEEIKLAKLWI